MGARTVDHRLPGTYLIAQTRAWTTAGNDGLSEPTMSASGSRPYNYRLAIDDRH